MSDTKETKSKRRGRSKRGAVGAGAPIVPPDTSISKSTNGTPPPAVDEAEARRLLRETLSAAHGEQKDAYPKALAFVNEKPIALVREALRFVCPVDWRSAGLGNFFASLSDEHARHFLALSAGFWSLGYVLGAHDGGNALIEQLAHIIETKGPKTVLEAITKKAADLKPTAPS